MAKAKHSLQASYLLCANNFRREAKLCDIVLYVQGRMGAMVGYPAHKLLLISASKYFKLLFEREDLRSYCHFPHLKEEGLFAVLDIIYGHEIREETDIEDALMAARFLQVDCAVEQLEDLKKASTQKKENHRQEYEESDVTLAEEIVLVPEHEQPAQIRLFKKIHSHEHSTSEDGSDVTYYNKQEFDTDHEGQGQFVAVGCDGFGSSADSFQSQQFEDPVVVKVEKDFEMDINQAEETSFSSYSYTVDSSNQLHGVNPADMNTQSETQRDAHQCSYCKLVFATEAYLQAHMSIHTDESTSKSADVNSMMAEGAPTTGEDKMNHFICGMCNSAFKNKSRLKQHMISHSAEKPHQCNLCGKGFTLKGNLNQHMLIHRGEKRYGCDVCGRRFIQLSNLKSHVHTHTRDDSFTCRICRKEFTSWDNLKDHSRREHRVIPVSRRASQTMKMISIDCTP